MAVPNHKAIVERVFRTFTGNLATKAGCGLFTEAVAIELHRVDPRFGHLKKSASRNHVTDALGNRHSVDAVLYLRPGAGKSVAIDIISASETDRAKPTWIEDKPRYSAEDWFAPVTSVEPDLGPIVPTPGTPSPSDLEARVAALEARVNRHLKE